MKTTPPNPDDFPFADLLGFKRKNETEQQKIGREFMKIANQFRKHDQKK